MPLLISLVFFDEMKVTPSNNNGPYHLGAVASACEDAAPDGNIASERAFLIDICSFDGFSGSLEVKPNALPESIPTLAWPLALSSFL